MIVAASDGASSMRHFIVPVRSIAVLRCASAARAEVIAAPGDSHSGWTDGRGRLGLLGCRVKR